MYGTGYEYWRSTTCERTQLKPQEGAIVKAPSDCWVVTSYIHYIPEYEMLELSKVAISNKGRHGHGDIHRWTYSDERIFLIRGDACPYDSNGEELWKEQNSRYYNKKLVEYIKKLKNTFFYDAKNPQYRELEKFCGNRIDPVKFATEYRKYMIPRKRTNVVPVPAEVCQEAKKYFLDSGKELVQDGTFAARFEQINETYSVICCYRTVVSAGRRRFSEPTVRLHEYQRIYITADGLTELQNHFGNWQAGSCDLQTIRLINQQDFVKCREVAHVIGIVQELQKEYPAAILELLRHPVLERLYKAGYQNIAKYLLLYGASEAFQDLFGKKEQKFGSLQMLTGCNKCMLGAIEHGDRSIGQYKGVIPIFREVFGNTFMCFTTDKIEKYKNAFIALSRCARVKQKTWTEVIFGRDLFRSEDRAVIERFVKIFNKEDQGIFEELADTVDLYSLLGMQYSAAVIDSMRTAQDIHRLHNRAVEQYNIPQIRRKAELAAVQKSFALLQPDRRKRFHYENDLFLIRMPESTDEIVQEGIRLHHCVGSYAHRHALGQTNIIFLRKKQMPDESFYTIEVSGEKVLQIHGQSNRWLGNNPEAVSFVYEWTRKTGVECDRSILLCQSQSYSRTVDMLDESFLYGEKAV